MSLYKNIQGKIFLMERMINYPAPLLNNKDYHQKNLSIYPYSNLKGAISSLVERKRKVLIITGFYIPSGNPPATETDDPPKGTYAGRGIEKFSN